MRRLKNLIKAHPRIMEIFYFSTKKIFDLLSIIIPVKEKTIIFVSLSGRNFDDSPRALYEEICKRHFFDGWTLIWAFKNPKMIEIPRGKKIKFGTLGYWFTLMRTQVWIENGGMDLGLQLNYRNHQIVRTFHGTPIKRIEGEEKKGVLTRYRKKTKFDNTSIRCAQSEGEIEVFMRAFNAARECFLKCGLPRNDILIRYDRNDQKKIKERLGIPFDKKIIIYMPTYREYLINSEGEIYIAPPINLDKWEEKLGDSYCLLIRAHYAVVAALDIKQSSFCFNVSGYQPLSELYCVADILISDYSSAFFDYSITGRPMRCFAYDYEEYEKNRGLLYDLEDILPCPVMETEDEIIESILTMDYDLDCKKTRIFKQKYANYFDGHASETVVNELEKRLRAK